MIIEFSGTPAAGKDSLIKKICANNKYISCQIIEPDDKEFDYRNSNLELRILWGILDSYSRIKFLLNKNFNTTSNLKVIFNRGLFDRIAWSRLLCNKNENYNNLSDYIEKWLKNNDILLQTDIIFVILTSYDKILSRREKYKSELDYSPWIVNKETIEKLNYIYLNLFEELNSKFKIVLIDDWNQNLSLEEKLFIINYHLRLVE